jgi:hypothetical protein
MSPRGEVDGAGDARALARALLARDAPDGLPPEARGPAMQRAATRVLDDLSRAVGTDGLEALLVRALLRVEAGHPAVARMRHAPGADLRLDVGAAVAAHGPDAASVALEAVLAALVDILSALIGADMTRNLLHDDAT